MNRKLFPLQSRLIFTPEVLERIPEQELLEAFARHDTGDWGLVTQKTYKQNKVSLRRGGILVSEYKSRKGEHFRVTTSDDSRFTTFQIA